MEVEDTEENQDPLPSTSEQGTSLNINFIKLEPVFQSETVDKPHPVIIKSEPPVKFESVKSEPTYSSDDEVLEEVEPQYVDQTDIKEEFTVVEEESVDLDDDVKEEIEIDAVDGLYSDLTDSSTTKTKQEKPLFQCNKCTYSTCIRPHIIRHLHKHIDDKRKPCLYCDKQFKRKCDLDSHVLGAHKHEIKDSKEEVISNKIHKCQQCSYETVRSGDFKRHLLKHSGTNLFKCDICAKGFSRKQYRDSHLLKKHRDQIGDPESVITCKIYNCDQCEYETIRFDDYKRHMLYHDDKVGAFVCELCGFKAVDKRSFARHQLVHSDTKLITCSFCDKGFNKRQHYNSHLLTNHKNEVEDVKQLITQKIHKCAECSYETMQLCNLRRHQTTHGNTSELKEHRCAECKFKTVHQYSLEKHKRIHSNVRRFTCPECTRGFNYKNAFDGHILSVHRYDKELMAMVTTKLYECDECDYKTIKNTDLPRHKKDKHGVVVIG